MQLWYVIYYRLSQLGQHDLFFLQGSLAQPCLPLGWVCAYQQRGPLTEPCSSQSYFHCLSLPSCKAALLNLVHFLCARALPSQHKGPLTWPCSCQSFFSVYLATGLPLLLPFYLSVLSADWCLVQGAVSGFLGICLKKYKSRLVANSYSHKVPEGMFKDVEWIKTLQLI
jgi:hypothetical protein